MRHSRAVRLSPALVVGMIALFVALGGPGLAAKKPVFQQRCQTGAIKGVVAINEQALRTGFPDSFSSAARLFDARFSCGGGAISARRIDVGTFEIRTPGNPAGYAVGSPTGGGVGAFSYTRLQDGTWRVFMSQSGAAKADVPFVLVLL